MAKKNLSSLLGGIMGDPQEENDSNAVSAPVPQEPAEPAAEEPAEEPAPVEPQPASATPAKEAPARRRGPGRPRKNEGPIEEVRATFIVDQRQIKKIKYISVIEDCLLKDIVGKALEAYIVDWEAENGRIKLPNKKS